MTTNEIMAPASRPLISRLRRSYFSSIPNIALSAISIAILAALAWWLFDWTVLTATFSANASPQQCLANGGACWTVIAQRWRIILFGLYPFADQWRSGLACVVVIAMVVSSCLPRFWSIGRLALVWSGGFAVFYFLMKGGVFGLSRVDEQQWGGLALTLFIFITTCIVGMPLAIGLMLMRRSELFWIARVTGLFIDTVRSLPLLSILFVFALVLPFVLPDWLNTGKLYRVILGNALFFAVYQAEILRGGMQGVGAGQDEAAKALGIPYRHRVARILLPQAFRIALPSTINQIVIAFMETSLIVVVGFFELMASANAAYSEANWSFAYAEVYAFVAAIYFVFVFGLSRYGAYLERRMTVGRH